MTTKFPRGAEWRKWDLHVHTPSSIHQNYGADNEDTWEKFISDLEALPEEFAVVGVNDYLFLDGYERLLQEQRDNNRLSGLTLFPIVEFRIEKFSGVDFGRIGRINFHVIFSNELTIETIQSQFLNTLEQSYKIDSEESWNRAITRDSIEALGKKIKDTVPEDKLPDYGSDLEEGFNNLNIDEKAILNSLEKDCFKEKYLTAIGKAEWSDMKWSGASIATKKSIINKAHIVFTASDSIESFNSSREKLKEQKVNHFLLDCSDAHNYSDSPDKDRIGNCSTWLKADPTFEGLKQVLIEPDKRVYVGPKPPLFGRIEGKRTKYIKSLSICQAQGYHGQEGIWFDNVSIPLNSELVAIIGNKGSGKSAIADIIALCANYQPKDDVFSFLTTEKFKKNSLARHFNADMVWESGKKSSINLDALPENSQLLDIKYLPQGQFERLTNEIRTVEEFQREIEHVVFSRIPETERLDAQFFSKLIEMKTDTVNLELDRIRTSLQSVNQSIINLERQSTPAYMQEIQNKLARKEEELNSLLEPTPILDPNEDPQKKLKSQAANSKIQALLSEVQKLRVNIEQAEDQKRKALGDIQKLKNAKLKIQQRKADMDSFISQIEIVLNELGVDAKNLISMEIDLTELDTAIYTKEQQLNAAKGDLGEIDSDSSEKSLPEKLEEYESQVRSEQSNLDTEQQKYQQYLAAREAWEKDKEAIIGSPEKIDTIEYYKLELKYLNDQISIDLEEKYQERKEIVETIFDKKQAIISVYRSARDQLKDIIAKNQETLGNYSIEVDAALVKKSDFDSKFFGFILHNKMGSFYSIEGSEAQLTQMTSKTDFDDKNSVINFLDEIVCALRHDKRDGYNDQPREVAEQVKDIEGLYDYLFTLDFLENNYQLKQGGKVLELLSPGERGALLLVFYLLLDKNDIPLVIDQPEDNLDNHSIASILVPFIQAAKKNRQIIMVTHNPNLAVVSDAEQVIYVDLDKNNDYTFSVISGSIEDKEVNKKIVDVLEGAMPAFNVRKNKYYE